MKYLSKYLLLVPVLFPIAARAQLENPIGENDPRAIIANVIQVFLGILGSIALIMFIYAGLSLMISGGNPEKVKKAQKTLVWAVIGLILIFGSYGILNFVFETLSQ